MIDWTPSLIEGIGLIGSCLTTIVLFWLLLWRVIPSPVDSFDATLSTEWSRKLVEWERDRVLSVSKGLAKTGAGFLVALLTAVLKDELRKDLSVWSLLGSLAGGVGALILGGLINARTVEFTRNPGLGPTGP